MCGTAGTVWVLTDGNVLVAGELPKAVSALPASSLRSVLGAARPNSDSGRRAKPMDVGYLGFLSRVEPVAWGRVNASI